MLSIPPFCFTALPCFYNTLIIFCCLPPSIFWGLNDFGQSLITWSSASSLSPSSVCFLARAYGHADCAIIWAACGDYPLIMNSLNAAECSMSIPSESQPPAAEIDNSAPNEHQAGHTRRTVPQRCLVNMHVCKRRYWRNSLPLPFKFWWLNRNHVCRGIGAHNAKYIPASCTHGVGDVVVTRCTLLRRWHTTNKKLWWHDRKGGISAAHVILDSAVLDCSSGHHFHRVIYPRQSLSSSSIFTVTNMRNLAYSMEENYQVVSRFLQPWKIGTVAENRGKKHDNHGKMRRPFSANGRYMQVMVTARYLTARYLTARQRLAVVTREKWPHQRRVNSMLRTLFPTAVILYRKNGPNPFRFVFFRSSVCYRAPVALASVKNGNH